MAQYHNFSVDNIVVDDDVTVYVEDHLTLGVRGGDMPAVSTNVGRGGGDGDRQHILGIVEEERESQVCRLIWSLAQNYLIYDISTRGYITDVVQYSTESSDSLDSKTY